MTLITTNEELGKLNSAITRPGRCFSEISFERLNVEEANAWMRGSGCASRVDRTCNLSELYAIANGLTREESARKIGFRTH